MADDDYRNMLRGSLAARLGHERRLAEAAERKDETVDLTAAKTIQAVWNKGKVVRYLDSKTWRQDDDGKRIKRDEYGNRESDYGWEMDHIVLKKDGGKDVMKNLRPLYWKTNAARQEN